MGIVLAVIAGGEEDGDGMVIGRHGGSDKRW